MSNQDPLETSKVNALDSKALHGVRPSTEQGPFLGASWASTDKHHSYPAGSAAIPYKHATLEPARGGGQGRTQEHA